MTGSLREEFTGFVCDLDGVVYAGPAAIAHAVEALNDAQAAGIDVVYATNNASRPPGEVARHLRSLGLEVADDGVVNSSVAGALVLSRTLPPGSAVLAVGGEGVGAALREAGLDPVSPGDHAAGAHIVAVLQGYGPQVTASDLAEAAYAVQGGARWVATNVDRTLPTDRGVAPGNGSLVGAVSFAVRADPEVVGKPAPVMYEVAAERIGGPTTSVLAIGDRLETDIEGACAAGMRSVLVLTGVHGWADAAGAPACRRPTYVMEDLRGLAEPYEAGQVQDGRVHCTEGTATLTSQGELTVKGQVTTPLLRGVLQVLWAAVDSGRLNAEGARRAMEELTGGRSAP